MTSAITRRTGAVAFSALAVLGAAGAVWAGSNGRSVGPDEVYGAPNPLAGARAAVHVAATGKGTSHVTLHVWDVDGARGRTFGAHVHEAPCGELPGSSGGHYQHAGAVGTLEQREVWLDVTINAAGHGRAKATRPWVIDQSAPRSVVIHELPTVAATGAAGPRLACIDLDGDG